MIVTCRCCGAAANQTGVSTPVTPCQCRGFWCSKSEKCSKHCGHRRGTQCYPLGRYNREKTFKFTEA